MADYKEYASVDLERVLSLFNAILKNNHTQISTLKAQILEIEQDMNNSLDHLRQIEEELGRRD